MNVAYIVNGEVVNTGSNDSSNIIHENTTVKSKLNEISNNLVNSNGDTFIYDYQNGKYGFNTDPNRGADTFHPFSGGEAELLWTNPSAIGSDFTAQTINESSTGWVSGKSLADYDYILIKTQLNQNYPDSTTINLIDKGAWRAISDPAFTPSSSKPSVYAESRNVFWNDNGIQFTLPYGSSSKGVYPLEIRGCKSSGNVPVSANAKVVVNKYWDGNTSSGDYGMYYDSNGTQVFGSAYQVVIDNEYYSKTTKNHVYTVKKDMLYIHFDYSSVASNHAFVTEYVPKNTSVDIQSKGVGILMLIE